MGGIVRWVEGGGLGLLVGLYVYIDVGYPGYRFMYFYSVSEPSKGMLHTDMARIVLVFA